MKRAKQILIHSRMINGEQHLYQQKNKFKQMKRLQQNNLSEKKKILSVPFDK